VSSSALDSPATTPGARGIGIVLVLLIALVQIAGVVALDVAVRAVGQQIVGAELEKALDTDHDDVDVEIGGFSVLAQAVSGRVEEVRLRINDIELGRLNGDLAVTARDVPFDVTAPSGKVDALYTIETGELRSLVPEFSGVEVDDVRIGDHVVVIEGSIAAYSSSARFEVDLVPDVRSGDLAFETADIRVDGTSTTVEELRAEGRWGALVRALTAQETACIADQMPKDFSLTAITVGDGELVAELEASRIKLGALSLDRMGDCQS